ncbi:MAG: zinc-ribbon domain-containing protein [Lachnospiraceae bacterium]|nr:zinc-ribbon domain-containing protein [Lachnospiraceae bacterium]
MKTFAEVHPELISEWAPENELIPDRVSYGSNKMVIWNGSCGHIWKASVKNRGNGHGCPYCSGNQVLTGFNDLETYYPELAKEWSELNLPVLPSEVTVKANKRVWWKCRNCGHRWQARVADRTDGHGCPVCAGEKLIACINDLATEHPEIASEWSDANGDLKPTMVWSKSRQNVLWKCRECGHEYRAVIDSRVKGLKCPYCKHRDIVERCPFNSKAEAHIFKTNMLVYYAKQAGEEVVIGDEDQIGIKLETYLPYRKAAIIFSSAIRRECLVRRENAKNWLCLKAGIKLFRIMSPGASDYDNCVCITLSDNRLDTISLAVQTVFDMIGIDADVDISRDTLDIKKFLKVAQNATSL